jgi:hypothetical protein
MSISFPTDLLLGIYQSKLTLNGAASGGGAPVATHRYAPTAPWLAGDPPAAQTSAAISAAIAGQKLIDENAAKLDLPGASTDYKKLFALYQGLSTLDAIAVRSQTKNISAGEKAQLSKAFASGLQEVEAYIPQAGLEKVRLVQGETALSAKTTVAVPATATEYKTPPLVSGTSSTPVPGFQGNVKFTISIKRSAANIDVPIDLAGMNATPRTMGNVVNYINDQLAAAGVDARFASERIAGQPKTTLVGGKTVTIGQTPDQWALGVKVTTGETVSFSAPDTAGSVYVAQNVGDPDPDHKASTNDSRAERQLLKFQTDTATVPSPIQPDGEANWVDGRVFAKSLGAEVGAVHATQVAADGSVYVLADVTGKTENQDIRGTQDVALLKYDSAGKLLYSRTLGAAASASGLGLAVAADGKVAVTGSVSGALDGVADSPLNSGTTGAYAGKTDSFVTLYDAGGQELWTERRGARDEDQATNVAFGADGTIYVTGRTKSGLPNTNAIGDWDSYVEAFSTTAAGQPNVLFTQTFGSAGSDKPAGLVVDGTNLVTASVEGGHAILRRFDISSGTPVPTATRDLGDLQGGSIAGLALDGADVVIAGTTSNAALNAGAVTRAASGGSDAFAARIASDLSAGGSIAYYGGAGEDTATALAVSNGKVWIGGQAGDAPIDGQSKLGTTRDGFLASLDVDAGTVGWERRFAGKDGRAAPTAIAVDASGASVLDRIGLPKGPLTFTDSQRLIDQSSLRAGDTFTVRVDGGHASTVTIDAADTLDTLAQKIRRASGFEAKVTIGVLNGARHLTIAPANDRQIIELGPGKTDRNALQLLGLPESVVRTTKLVGGKSVPADGGSNIFGMGLASDLKLGTLADYNHARAELQTAMGVVRSAYKDLVAQSTPKAVLDAQAAAASAAKGAVPAYLTAQVANYQAALDRLTGGG